MAGPDLALHNRSRSWPRPWALGAAGLLHATIVAALMLGWRPSHKLPTQRPLTVSLVFLPPREPEKPPPAPAPRNAGNDKAPRFTPATAADDAASLARMSEAQPPQQTEEQPTFGRAEMQDGAVLGAQPPSVVDERPLLPQGSEVGRDKPKSRRPAGTSKVQQATKRAPTPAAPPAPHEPSTQEPAHSTVSASPGAAVYGVAVEGTGAIASITLLQSSGRTDFDAAGEQMVRTSMQFPPPQSSEQATRYFTVTLRFTP